MYIGGRPIHLRMATTFLYICIRFCKYVCIFIFLDVGHPKDDLPGPRALEACGRSLLFSFMFGWS